LEEGYVIFAKVREEDAAKHVRELNAQNPPPAAGKRYLSVAVIMSSAQQASKTLAISSDQFGMICSSGKKVKPLTNLGAKGLDGEMSGGRQLFGELIFEIEANEQWHLLTYEPEGKPGVEYYLALSN
jgi:hypothetical protein